MMLLILLRIEDNAKGINFLLTYIFSFVELKVAPNNFKICFIKKDHSHFSCLRMKIYQ